MIYKVPNYLHRPLQLLWFEQDEWVAAAIGYAIGMILSGWFWLALFVVPYLYIRLKRSRARGYMLHSQYRAGFYGFHGYPHAFCTRFRE